MPSDNEFVACVDRKKVTKHHYYIWYNKMYNLVVVVVLGLGLGLVVVVVAV